MNPLYEQRDVVECSYVFCITADVDGTYWDIPLAETEETRNLVKKHIWPIDSTTLKVELSLNDKNAIITFPDGVIRTVRVSEKQSPEPTRKDKVERINEDIEKLAKRTQLHKLLERLGIRFEIDFHHYREDSDYMRVYVNDEEVHSGTTEDLPSPKKGVN